MAIRYESGSTYFPGYETNLSTVEYISAEEIAHKALVNRREITLLEEESVMKVAAFLAEHARKPDFGFAAPSQLLIVSHARYATQI